MGLAELFGGPSEPETGSGAEEPSGEPVEVSLEWQGESVTTPSGIEILYDHKPHAYKLRRQDLMEEGEWQDAVSVTTALEVLAKGGIGWWGMRVGIHAMMGMIHEGVPVEGVELDSHYDKLVMNAQVAANEQLIKDRKWTVNHRKDQSGERGSSVHQAFEVWAETGELPCENIYPESEQGYIHALQAFLEESKLEPLRSEVMVGSLQYGYAGRYDLQAFYGGHEVVTHLTPKKEKRGELCEPGLGMFDLKTSSGIYPETHYRQLEAYEQASVECGYDPTDFRAVVQVCADGRYQVKLSTATFDQFRNVLDVYNDNQVLKGRKNADS